MHDKPIHDESTEPPTRPHHKSLSFKTKLAYGAGDAGAGITATLLAFSFLIFLTNVANLRPALAGTVLLIGKIWDAVNDPIIGYLSDRTRSRWGRRHSWMLVASIPFGIFFFLYWIVPTFSEDPGLNQWGRFIYYTVISIIFNAVSSAVTLPYTALTPELSRDYDERTSLTSYRFLFSIGGSILALALGQFFAMQFPNDSIAQYLSLGGVCAILSVLPIYWCVWGTTDPTAFDPRQRAASPGSELDLRPSGSIWVQFQDVLQSRPFWYVIGIYLCSWLSFQLTAAIIPYYAVSYMEMDSYFSVALVVQGTAMLALVFWNWISYKYGRKRAYFAGMMGWIVAQILLFFLPSDRVDWLYILCALAGLGVSTAYLIPWSMLTDVTDLDELNTGEQRQGTFYALMVFLQKTGLALGVWLAGIILELSGFVESLPGEPIPPQPESALFAIRLVVGPLPALLLMIGLLLMYHYPVTRELQETVILRLRERRESLAQAKTLNREIEG